MNPVYCLDFDGVLCDSADECVVVGYNAYYGREIEYPEQIAENLRSFFYRNRRLVRPAGEFYLLFEAYEGKTGDLTESRFLELKNSSLQAISSFTKSFYVCRSRLKSNIEHWLGLHKIYPQAANFLKGDSPPFYVVTNKDKDSIEKIARRSGFLHRVEAIYSREVSLKKRELFKNLFADSGNDPASRRVLYVDDSEGNLDDLRGLFLELYLASWGYSGKTESSGFKVIHSLDELS